MKAGDGQVVGRDHREEQFDMDRSDVDPLDGFVMILFPQVTWNAVQDLAKKTGVTPSELMSLSLKLMEEKLKEEAANLSSRKG